MTHYPKRDCGERFCVAVVLPGDRGHFPVEYCQKQEEVDAIVEGVCQRPDAEGAFVTDRIDGVQKLIPSGSISS